MSSPWRSLYDIHYRSSHLLWALDDMIPLHPNLLQCERASIGPSTNHLRFRFQDMDQLGITIGLVAPLHWFQICEHLHIDKLCNGLPLWIARMNCELRWSSSTSLEVRGKHLKATREARTFSLRDFWTEYTPIQCQTMVNGPWIFLEFLEKSIWN